MTGVQTCALPISGDAAHVNEHVVQSREADVWHAVAGVGDACAGEIQCAETSVLGEDRRISVDYPGELQGAFHPQRGAELCASRVGDVFSFATSCVHVPASFLRQNRLGKAKFNPAAYAED